MQRAAAGSVWALAVAMFALVHADNFGAASLVCAVAAMSIVLAFAYRDMALDRVIAVAGALPLALLASWNLPPAAPEIERVFRLGPPDQVEHFAVLALVSAILLGGLFLVLPRVARPGRWAALSAAAPPLILSIAYWRLRKFGFDITWSGAALDLSIAMRDLSVHALPSPPSPCRRLGSASPWPCICRRSAGSRGKSGCRCCGASRSASPRPCWSAWC